MIDLRATALSGLALIAATAGASLYNLAQGEDGSPYSELMAVAGIAYLPAVAVLRLRS
jgi:hypothetical protein